MVLCQCAVAGLISLDTDRCSDSTDHMVLPAFEKNMQELKMNTILLGERYRTQLEQALIDYGFSPLWVPDNPCVDPRLAGHVDLSGFAVQDTLILSRVYLNMALFVKELTNRGITYVFAQREQYRNYPADAGLCAFAV